jgi:hypothetical protein
MLGLPHISAKSFYPLTYHCVRYYNTGLTIHFPQHNNIYNIISCYSNHPSNIILSSQILNPIIYNTITYIFINNSKTINTFQYHQHPFIITISPTNISQTHSHIFSCISLHYLIITFPFIIRISCILQYQFINIYHIHNINLIQYSTSIQRHVIIRNTNPMHPSTSIHQHFFTI